MMLPGPVFNAELITTARRTRYYVARFIYGMILLLLVWINYVDPPMGSRAHWGTEMTIQDMEKFADGLFATFSIVQCLMVLALTPTLLAGVIVDEKQRKTLNYLMASPLTSAEIVLGKLAARLLHVGVFVSLGLPVMSLLSLFGGVDPGLVVTAYAATLSTAFFLSALAILVSTTARKVREAVAVVYVLELAWLALPPLIDGVTSSVWPQIYSWIKEVNDWIYATNPIVVVGSLSSRRGAIGLGPIVWMVGLQVLYASVFVLLAVWRLRPIFQRQESGPGKGRLARLSARLERWQRRLLPRPACGDDSMLWKEQHSMRFSGLAKLMVFLVALVFCAFLGYGLVYFGSRAVSEMLVYGYGSAGSDQARSEFNAFLRFVGTTLYMLWILSVAATGASGVTTEREADTWMSLVSTPLSGVEILRAKMIGSLWSVRWLGAVLILIWTIGLLTGSIHPLGFLAVLIELAAFTSFAVALGTYASLWSKTTLRAQALTISILVVLNGGYLLCCLPVQPDTTLILLGCSPFIEAISLLSFEDVRGLLSSSSQFRSWTSDRSTEIIMACVLGLFGYAAGAFAFLVAALNDFDRAVDRPRQARGASPQPEFADSDSDESEVLNAES